MDVILSKASPGQHQGGSSVHPLVSLQTSLSILMQDIICDMLRCFIYNVAICLRFRCYILMLHLFDLAFELDPLNRKGGAASGPWPWLLELNRFPALGLRSNSDESTKLPVAPPMGGW